MSTFSRVPRWSRWVGIWLLLHAVSLGEVESKLPLGVKKKLQAQVVPAYYAGNSLSIIRVLGPLVDRLDEPQRLAADSLLQSYQMPAVEQLLLEARLALLPFEPDRRIPQPGRRELRLLIRALAERIQVAVDSKLPSEKQDVPGTLDRFERRFWEYDAAASQLDQAARLASYGHGLLTSTARRAPELSRNKEAASFHRLASRLESQQQGLEESSIRLRLARWQLTDTILRGRTDYADRLAAAYLMEMDTRQLVAQSARNRHPELISDTLVAVMEKRLTRLHESEPRLMTAAGELFPGLEWWMRGRYGLGPEGNGLLKSELAVSSPEAQLGIFMPSEPPDPTVPGDTEQDPVPRFQRRHHFIWLYEYRQLHDLLYVDASGDESLQSDARWQLSRYYSGADQLLRARNLAGDPGTNLRGISRRMTGDDARKVNRLVGFLEYGKALEHLEAFLAERTAEELQSLENWLQLRDELAIYTSLVPASQRPARRGNDDTTQPAEQRGLGWIMALARLEFAAMAATFTQLPQPFAAVRPTTYELPQYCQLLAEAFHEHYVALQTDKQLRRLTQGQGTPTDLLRYSRRLVLTKALWQAHLRQITADGEPQALQRLASKKAQLDVIERLLLLRLDQFIQGMRAGSDSADTRFSYLWRDAENVRSFLRSK